MRRVSCWSFLFGVWAAGALLAPVQGQSSQKPIPPLLIESLSGRDLYVTYCAGCHGREAKGDGPVAQALKMPPPDLTTLARRSGGKFEASLVEATLNGTRPQEPSTAHGTREMPIWGSIFRELDPNSRVARVRVENLVKYLESIQLP